MLTLQNNNGTQLREIENQLKYQLVKDMFKPLILNVLTREKNAKLTAYAIMKLIEKQYGVRLPSGGFYHSLYRMGTDRLVKTETTFSKRTRTTCRLWSIDKKGKEKQQLMANSVFIKRTLNALKVQVNEA